MKNIICFNPKILLVILIDFKVVICYHNIIIHIFFSAKFSFSFYKSTIILLRFLNCTVIDTLHTGILLDKVLKLDVLVFWHCCE